MPAFFFIVMFLWSWAWSRSRALLLFVTCFTCHTVKEWNEWTQSKKSYFKTTKHFQNIIWSSIEDVSDSYFHDIKSSDPWKMSQLDKYNLICSKAYIADLSETSILNILSKNLNFKELRTTMDRGFENLEF